MKWFTKTLFLLVACLLLPCIAIADISVEDAKPIKGGKTLDGALLLTEAKYAQVWMDEAPEDNRKQYYKFIAPGDGVYHVSIYAPDNKEKVVDIDLLNSHNGVFEVIKGHYVLSISAKHENEFVMKVSPNWSQDVGKFYFSICFDGYHAPGVESEIAHYATCSAEGEIIYPCTLCGQPGKSESIPKIPHTLGDWQKERNPGCTTTGLNVQRCTVCGEIVNQQEIPAIGHGSSKQIVTKPATCMETGLMSEQCTVCLETLSTQVLPMGDHTPGMMKTVMAASCTMNGRGEQRCTVCNALLKEETTSAYGHNYSEWETIVEPTKKAEGQKMRYCYNCANIEYEKIEKLPKFMGIF